MTAQDIISKLQADEAAGRPLNFKATRELIHEAARCAKQTEERVLLIRLFNSVMDMVERGGNIKDGELDEFKATRIKDYNLLLTPEFMIGENVSLELLDAVTRREVTAGRMSENHPMRLLVIEGLQQPFKTVHELIELEQKRLKGSEKAQQGWRNWFK